MKMHSRMRTLLFAAGLAVAWPTAPAPARETPGSAAGVSPAVAAERSGEHDFDFEIGTWETRLSRLERPLSGSTRWLQYEGTTVVRKVWGGRANLVELDVTGTAGHLEILSLRLYDPRSRQWSLNVATVRGGTVGVPSIGEFRDGRGEFYSHEEFDGRWVLVRFVISDVTPVSCRFEQAYSDDGGRTWEVNWIATDTRLPEGDGAAR